MLEDHIETPIKGFDEAAFHLPAGSISPKSTTSGWITAAHRGQRGGISQPAKFSTSVRKSQTIHASRCKLP